MLESQKLVGSGPVQPVRWLRLCLGVGESPNGTQRFLSRIVCEISSTWFRLVTLTFQGHQMSNITLLESWYVNVNVNVKDTIFWLSPTTESCSWIDFISVAYASSWYHWNCGRTQRKAATINQLACPSYSLYVQLLWYPMYYPGGMKARVCPVQWSKTYSILAPTQDSNPGGRIQNHNRWSLHYHCTHEWSV